MTVELIPVPDLGGAEDVEVIEILVGEGDVVAIDDSLVTVESDKASMEVPSPYAGKVLAIKVQLGDKVNEGDVLIELEVNAGATPASNKISQASDSKTKPEAASFKAQSQSLTQAPVQTRVQASPSKAIGTTAAKLKDVYAGPSVRKLARELNIDLRQVQATGPRGRLQKDDLHNYIRTQLEMAKQGSGVPPIPEVDFSRFGEVVQEPLSKIARVTAENLHRAWLNIPHVTQFDEAALTEMDKLRAAQKKESEQRGIKLTPLAYLLKAAAIALQAHPKFNSSLHADGQHVVRKKYIHLGLAVDTPVGLMVPVVRDVDQKDIWCLAEEVVDLSGRAREGKLKPAEMQGGCFTISSLGAIGGQGFTPVVNAPEVAILGVSKAQIKPVWDGSTFQPVKQLPLCLSYDHRAVNGADAGRFMTYLVEVIETIDQFV